MSSNLKVNSLVPATGTEIGIGTTGGSIDFRCAATFGGNVTIGGTLTYDEVINIDSIGVITARSNIDCNGSLDVDGHTDLDNVNISGVTTFAGNIDANGDIGIGTASPQRIIHAFEPTGNNLLFLESGDTNVDIIQADTGGSTRIRNSQGSLVFYVNGDAKSSNAANAVTGLTIDGDKDVHVYDDLFIPDKIIHEGDTNTSIRFPAADQIQFETAGSNRLNIGSTGNLQFNTTANGQAVILKSTGNFYTKLSFDANRTSAGGTLGFIDFSWDTDKVADIMGVAGSDTTNKDDGHLVFRTSPSQGSIAERLRINSNGDVRVTSRGSSYSGAPFYVAVTGKSSITYGGGNDDTACLRIVDNGSTNSYYHGIELRSKRDGDARIYAQDKGNDSCDLVFATDNSGITEKVRITSDGRVSIGNRTTSPNSLLHVHTSSGDANARIEGASHARLRLTAHNGASIFEFGDASSDSVGKITYNHIGTNVDSMVFRTAGTDRLTLFSNGKLDLLADEGIFVRSSSDNGGAKIRFSTNPAGGSPYNQIGHIIYYHGDNSILSGYGEGLVMGGTESNGFILRLDGALNIKDSDSAGGDGAKLLLGTDKDMRIYHSGGDGFIDGTGTGGLRIRYNDIIISNYNSSGTRRCRFHSDQGIEVFTVTNASGGSSGGAIIAMSDASDFSQVGKIRYVHSDNSVVNDGTSECFVMEGSESQTAFKLDGRFYISDSKFVLKPTFSNFDNIPNGTNSSNDVGCMMKYHSEANGNSGVMSNSAVEPFIANRSGSDGTVIRIRHQGNTEGEIKVNGSSVSYNTFMGAHKAQFADHSKPDLLIGTVLETVDQLATWKYASFSVGVGTDATTKYIPYYGSKNDGETDTITFDSNTYSATIKNYRDPMPEITKHVCVKVSDTVGSKAVFGVFNCWEEEDVVERESGNAEYSWNDLDVAALGDYFIRMQSGQTPAVGDYVESAGDGTAKVQSDDILRSKTIAKITSTTKQKTYDDGSFLVTCTLHCG